MKAQRNVTTHQNGVDSVRKSSSSSISSVSTVISPLPQVPPLELYSFYEQEKVHIYDKLCSSVSLTCEIAYATSDGIFICSPKTYIQQTFTSNPQYPQENENYSSMMITRIHYPHIIDSPNSLAFQISSSAPSCQAFSLIKQWLKVLYEAYSNRPSSLSAFDRLLCHDTTQYRGYRTCMFLPCDLPYINGQNCLATITCLHELFIYEVLSCSKRYYESCTSKILFDLTTLLMNYLENHNSEYFPKNSNDKHDYRYLYTHLTSAITWINLALSSSPSTTLLFQLQYSGHLIIWEFDGMKCINSEPLAILDSCITKPLTMTWHKDEKLLVIVGKENKRVLIKMNCYEHKTPTTLYELKSVNMYIELNIFDIKQDEDENDSMNAEHLVMINYSKQQKTLIIEAKMNYCLIYKLEQNRLNDANPKSTAYSVCHCHLINSKMLHSNIIGFQILYSSDEQTVVIGCEDGSLYSLTMASPSADEISFDFKLIVTAQSKHYSPRKPLLCRHFTLMNNQLLLNRIFYSPIVNPNEKFGYVSCVVHIWPHHQQQQSLNSLLEQFLGKTTVPLWKSYDELALILYYLPKHRDQANQILKRFISPSIISQSSFYSLQRLCRLQSLLESTSLALNKNRKSQQVASETKLLQKYLSQLNQLLVTLFGTSKKKLTKSELCLYNCVESLVDESLTKITFILTCPLCNGQINNDNLSLFTCTCVNNHCWPRCNRTFLPLQFDKAQCCSLCERTIISLDPLDNQYENFANESKQLHFLFSTVCTYCT